MDMDKYLQQFMAEATKKVDAEIQEENLKAMATIGVPMFTVQKSFVEAGFTKAQALELVKALLVSAINGAVKK